MKNKYGIISGGYIFDELDKTAHNIAQKQIGECTTASASITYLKEMKEKDLRFDYRVHKEGVKCYITTYSDYFEANFLFIKRK